MGYLSPDNLWRPVGSIDDRTDTGSICPVATNDANELLYVMPADGEDRPARAPAELGRAESIRLLGGVIELVLHERHELGIPALPAVFGVQRDDEIRYEAEPLLYLHLRPGAGPLAHCTLGFPLFALADDSTALATVLDDGPEKADFSMRQMRVLLVMELRCRIEECCLYPFGHVFGGDKGGRVDIVE